MSFDYEKYYENLFERFLKEKEFASADVEKVSLTICCPEYGWMPSRLTIGSDIFPITFSDVYSPFCEIVRWVTKICCDIDVERLFINDEHEDHFFKITKTHDVNLLIFEYSHFYFSICGVYKKTIVNKNDFIKEFYCTMKGIMEIDFESESKKDWSEIWFHFDRNSDDIITFDLSGIEDYLETVSCEFYES